MLLLSFMTTAENQSKMATEGGIDMLVDLLGSANEHVQRQAAKALANLGVNGSPIAVSLCLILGQVCCLMASCRGCGMVRSGQQGTDREGRRH